MSPLQMKRMMKAVPVEQECTTHQVTHTHKAWEEDGTTSNKLTTVTISPWVYARSLVAWYSYSARKHSNPTSVNRCTYQMTISHLLALQQIPQSSSAVLEGEGAASTEAQVGTSTTETSRTAGPAGQSAGNHIRTRQQPTAAVGTLASAPGGMWSWEWLIWLNILKIPPSAAMNTDYSVRAKAGVPKRKPLQPGEPHSSPSMG